MTNFDGCGCNYSWEWGNIVQNEITRCEYINIEKHIWFDFVWVAKSILHVLREDFFCFIPWATLARSLLFLFLLFLVVTVDHPAG